jgi:quinoprotein glucose dehydrogenase
VLPGHGGGANYGGASFDPETGMLYVPSVTIPIGVKTVAGDPARGNLAYRHAPALGLPSIDGLLLVKPPYARITAYDLNKGDIAWQVPLGDGPRNHPLLKDLNLGPLGSDGKGHPLLTKSLLFVSLSRPVARAGETPERVGDRPLSKVAPEPPKFRAFDKKTGALSVGIRDAEATGRDADDLPASRPSVHRRGDRWPATMPSSLLLHQRSVIFCTRQLFMSATSKLFSVGQAMP